MDFADQSAEVEGIRAGGIGAGDITGGEAGDDVAAQQFADQSAGAAVVMGAGVDGGGGVAGGDGAPLLDSAGQSADGGVDRAGEGDRAAADIAGGDGSPVGAGQNADRLAVAGDGGVDQANVAHNAVGGQNADKSAGLAAGDGLGHVAEDVAVALEYALVGPIGRVPALLAGGGEVQVVHQFVAGADAGAAHAGGGGGGGADGLAVGVGRIVFGALAERDQDVLGPNEAVAVVVVAEHIELGDVRNVDQAVVIGIVVDPVGAGARGNGGIKQQRQGGDEG